MPDTLVSPGVELIHFERLRQIKEEGYDPARDDQHVDQALAIAAACYAMPAPLREHDRWWSRGQGWNLFNHPRFWPFHRQYWKPAPDDRVKELVKAGALIAAEIDRLKRREAAG